MTRTTLRVAEIRVDPAVQVRRANHEAAIQRYMESWEHLPPVMVYRLPDGLLLLADGFHRLAAAQRLGLAEVSVDLREGTREEALEYAVLANARSGEPLAPEERDDGIRRLRQLHPPPEGYSQRRIARLMGVGLMTVNRVFAADEVRRRVLWRPVSRVADRVLAEVSSAPDHMWEPLLKAADRRSWTLTQVSQAVRNVSDEQLPEELRRALLAGEADPVSSRTAAMLTPDFASPRAPVPQGTREDPVGADVAERLHPIEVEVRFSIELPGAEDRGRGIRHYSRQPERLTRVFRLAVNREGLEGLGDPRNPRESKGLVMVLHRLQQHLWQRGNEEGWPRPFRPSEEAG